MADDAIKPTTYEVGQVLFNTLRTFLALSGIDASTVKLTLEFAADDDAKKVIEDLKQSCSGPARSAAAAGNSAGFWQGVPYEFKASTPSLAAQDDLAAPRRRVEIKINIGADNWEEARWVIRQLETDLVENGGKLRPMLVSGGCSAGYNYIANEDETITHESWREANDEYCRSLGERSA